MKSSLKPKTEEWNNIARRQRIERRWSFAGFSWGRRSGINSTLHVALRICRRKRQHIHLHARIYNVYISVWIADNNERELAYLLGICGGRPPQNNRKATDTFKECTELSVTSACNTQEYTVWRRCRHNVHNQNAYSSGMRYIMHGAWTRSDRNHWHISRNALAICHIRILNLNMKSY